MNPWVVAAFAAILVFAVWFMSTVKSGYYKAKQALARQVNLFSRDNCVAFEGIGAMAMDKMSRKILFVEQKGDKRKIVSFDDVLSVELLEDGSTVTRTDSSGIRHLDRNTVNTLIKGARAATGGDPDDSGDSKGAKTGSVHHIELRVVLADVGDPYRFLAFWNSGGRGLSRTSGAYGRIRGQADRWCAKLQVLIKQADAAETHPRQNDWKASVLG